MPLCKICKKPHKLFPFKKSLVFLEDVHNALVTSTCPPSILGCEECGQPNARLVKRDDATKAFCNTHCEEKYYASDEPCERCAKTNARWVGRERSKRFCNAACEAAHYVPTKKETFEGAVTCLSLIIRKGCLLTPLLAQRPSQRLLPLQVLKASRLWKQLSPMRA